MATLLFSINNDLVREWQYNLAPRSFVCAEMQALKDELEKNQNSIVIADYDTMFLEINEMLSAGFEISKLVVLEKVPSIVTGKKLISRKIKAYGNSRMQRLHFLQLMESVENGDTWTYPELTAALLKVDRRKKLSDDAIELMQSRLTPKEIEVTNLILDGLTNDAIAHAQGITTRTVKAHIGAIFSKMHASDRVSLILLLKD